MRSRTERLGIVVGAIALIAAGLALLELRGRKASGAPRLADHVVVVSFDGLSGLAVAALGAERLPALYRVAERGAFTWNARSDPENTETLPNHISMLTGVPVSEHRYRRNQLEGRDASLILHESAFAVLARSRVRSAFVSSKAKFTLFEEAWGADIGAFDARDRSDEETVERWAELAKGRAPSFSFLHLAGIDAAGHATGWDFEAGSPYARAARRTTDLLDRVLEIIDTTPALVGRTALILTSDHGGEGASHASPDRAANYVVPFVVLLPSPAGGADLYALNVGLRADPEALKSAASAPPIRSAEVANLALGVLGLGAVPGSTANLRQDMVVAPPRADRGGEHGAPQGR